MWNNNTAIYLSRRNNQKKVNIKADKIKNIAIVVLAITVAALLGAIVSLKRSADLQNYAVANNCTWTYQGTMYGDNRDYVCK